MLTLDPLRRATTVLVAGDSHGDTQWMRDTVLAAARRAGASCVLQLGDFGWWPSTRFAITTQGIARRLDLEGVYFLSGNHEHHPDLLRQPTDADGLRPLGDRLAHLPHGLRWEAAGVHCLAVGGAGSIDRDHRHVGFDWFTEEALTPTDVDRAIEGGPVDVVFSHDAPTDVVLTGDFPMSLVTERTKLWAQESRERLQRIIDVVRPRLVLHGHWHLHHRQVATRRDGGGYTVMGLNCNRQPGAMALVTFADGDVEVEVQSLYGLT